MLFKFIAFLSNFCGIDKNCFIILKNFVFTGVVLATDQSSLGQGFYLHKKDLLGEFSNGACIFDTIPKKCVTVVPTPGTRKEVSYFKSTENVYEYLSLKTGISPKYEGPFTMKTTLESITKYVSGAALQVSGLTIDLYALKESIVLSQECQDTLPLSKALLADFETLPVKIADPNNKQDWLAYDSFLEKYGSHIVNDVNRGSRLRQWAFASSFMAYTERDFTVRACLDLSSDTCSLDLDACSNITSEEKARVEKLTMSDTLVLKGGTSETRAQLREKRTAELIDKFMCESESSPGNVQYKFTAIWELLKQRFLGASDDNFARSLNMEAYYAAFLDFGCTKQSQNDVPLRWLEQDGKSKLPKFWCKIAALGCRTDDDCHLSAGCYCYGKSCVDSKEVMSFRTFFIALQRSLKMTM